MPSTALGRAVAKPWFLTERYSAAQEVLHQQMDEHTGAEKGAA